MITLKNISRPPRMLVLNIPAALSSRIQGLKAVKTKRTLVYHDTGTGERRGRRVDINHGDSIRILAKSTLDVDEAVLQAPEVKAAINKTIKVIKKEEAKAKAVKSKSKPQRNKAK